MEVLLCKQCGSNSLKFENGYWRCEYCNTKYYPSTFSEKQSVKQIKASSNPAVISVHQTDMVSAGIALNDDIQRLLEKCKTDRKNARKYANLVLDIDPTNREALKYV